VMELVRGIKITEYCDQNQLPTRERLNLFILVCHAIQHAHQKGIIHRDIKPSNILVTLHDGVPVPKVIDFGIAKATQQELTDKTLFTQFQQFIGTPAYISPEQAEMSGLDIDTRADIYSLGVLLYELLVGQTPFDAKEMMRGGIDGLRQIIREKEPLRPSTRLTQIVGADVRRLTSKSAIRNPRTPIPSDLDWIVMKCLEKDRTRRYETANGLAVDIQRHLANEPVSARQPSAAYKLQKAWKRNKVVYTAAAAVVLTLAIGIGISMWQTRRARHAESDQAHLRQVAVNALEGEKDQRNRAEAERHRAEQRALEARRRAYASDMNIAKQALNENNLGHALEMLAQHVPKPEETDLRGWEWRYLWGQTRSDALFTLCQEANEINSLSVSPDGNLVAISVRGKGGLSLWNVLERREALRLAQDEQHVCAVISPVSPLLAFTGVSFDPSGRQQARLRLWNLVNRQVIAEKPLDGECMHLAISQDGSTMVTVTRGNRATYNFGGHITLWRLPEATELQKYPLPNQPSAFAVTPDLTRAALSMDGIRLLDLNDGRELWHKERGADTLAFSPDGKLLASNGDGDEILLWNAATGQESGQLKGHRAWVKSVVFWPDGRKLASGSADQSIRIWDVPTLTCLDTMRGHRQQIWQLALMPDHRTLVSGCRDGTVCFWDTSSTHPRQPRIEIPGSTMAWAFESDGQSVVALNEQGRVTRYKGASFEIPEVLLETGDLNGERFSSCFSGDGRRLARNSAQGRVQVWDIPSRKLWREFTNVTGQSRRFFASGNRLLILSLKDFVVHDWDVVTASEVQSWRAPADIIHFAVSPDNQQCVTLGYAGDVVVRNLTDKTTADVNIELRESHDGDYSPDGRWLAIPSSLSYARIYDVANWTTVTTLRGFFNEVYGTAFLPEGRLAVAASEREGIRLYDTATWQATLTLEAEGGDLWPTRISPDGNVIAATAVWPGRLQLWRAPPWSEIKTEIKKTEASKSVGSRQP
jgi:WD40 repeat protein